MIKVETEITPWGIMMGEPQDKQQRQAESTKTASWVISIFRIRDPDRFEKIAAGVQAIVVSFAVLTAGAWTFYAFNSQLQVENAQAQLTKLQRDAEPEPKVEVTLEVRQLDFPRNGRRTITGTIGVKNVGNITTLLRLENSPIQVFRVQFNNDGTESWELVRTLSIRLKENDTLGALSAHAGASNSAGFATFVDAPGLYVARFYAERSLAEKVQVEEMGVHPTGGGTIEWSANSYFMVK